MPLSGLRDGDRRGCVEVYAGRNQRRHARDGTRDETPVRSRSADAPRSPRFACLQDEAAFARSADSTPPMAVDIWLAASLPVEYLLLHAVVDTFGPACHRELSSCDVLAKNVQGITVLR